MFKQNRRVSRGSGKKSIEGRPQILCIDWSGYIERFHVTGWYIYTAKTSDCFNHIIMQATENWRQEGLETRL